MTTSPESADRLPHLELLCFGPPAARINAGDPPPELTWRKHLALLAYLALSPGRARTRDHLLGLLWPEKDETQARRSLNEALRRLRRVLGDERLVSRGHTVVLSDSALTVDALQFDAEAPVDPGRALARLRGDFMEGLIIDDAPALDEWLLRERERWRTRVSGVLLAEGTRVLAASRFEEAIELARRASAIQPYHEPAVRLVMLAAALAGDPATALAAFHDFGTRLEDGIGEKPGREITALAERIRRSAWRPSATAAEIEPDLVGREAAHRNAFETVAAALTNGPRLITITATHGMGRTRLLAECLGRLALEGAVTAVARPLETDVDAPWSTLRLLFRGGLDQAPGLLGANPEAVGVLAALVPGLGEHIAARPPRDAAQVGSALADALAAVLEDRPVALAIDDAHLADNASLAALGAALLRLTRAPLVAIVTSADPVSAPPRELLRLRSEVGRGVPGASVRLDPLGADDIRQLSERLAPWCESDADRRQLAERLALECSGNPLYVVALLRGLARMPTFQADFLTEGRSPSVNDSLPFSLPDLIQTSIAVRVSELDDDGQRVLAAASVLGAVVRPDLLAAVTDLPPTAVEERLSAAERRQLLRFDGGRYAFSAGLVAQAVRRQCVTPGQRAFLQRRATVALAGHPDLEARTLRAELLAASDPGTGAFEDAVEVVLSALAAGGARTARRALAAAERAIRIEPGPASRGRLDELRSRVDALS